MWREWSPEDLIGPLNEVERKNAPERLFLAGDADLLRSGRRVSIVGSRKVSPEGASRTRGLVKVLVERGITVVSGLAEGVDTAAHETAMNEGGRTVAVLGTPVPPQNPVDGAIVDVSALGVKLAYPDASLAVRPASDGQIELERVVETKALSARRPTRHNI
jgi:hypothetical protein